MHVEIEYRDGAKSELVRLLVRRSRSFEDALRYHGVFLDDIEAQLLASEGRPPGVLELERPDGGQHWWHYIDGVWVGYTLSDRRAWVFGPTTRQVQVFAFRSVPPASP